MIEMSFYTEEGTYVTKELSNELGAIVDKHQTRNTVWEDSVV